MTKSVQSPGIIGVTERSDLMNTIKEKDTGE